MRQGRDVLDGLDFQPSRLHGRDSTFAATTGAFDFHFHFLHTELDGLFSDLLRGQLPGKRSAFAATFESARTGTGPAQRITFIIGDGYRCIIERRSDVGHAHGYTATHLFTF